LNRKVGLRILDLMGGPSKESWWTGRGPEHFRSWDWFQNSKVHIFADSNPEMLALKKQMLSDSNLPRVTVPKF